jgi:hypothetical protein
MDPTIARLRYLNDAAHALNLSSPSIAAAFQARYDHIAQENDIDPPDIRAREICSACGHNMLSTATYTVPSGEKTRKKLHKMTRKDKTIVLECSTCLSTTEIKLKSTKRSRPLPGRTSQMQLNLINPISSSIRAASSQGSSTQNTRAKAKRAKNRNSLHAMLAKSKEQAQSDKGFGFGLMDLMKST